MTRPRSKHQGRKGNAGLSATEATSPVTPATDGERPAPPFPSRRTQCGGDPRPPACTPRRAPPAWPPAADPSSCTAALVPGPHTPHGTAPRPARPDPRSGPQELKCPHGTAPPALPASTAASRTMTLRTGPPATAAVAAAAAGPGPPGLPVPASPGQRQPEQAADFLRQLRPSRSPGKSPPPGLTDSLQVQSEWHAEGAC